MDEIEDVEFRDSVALRVLPELLRQAYEGYDIADSMVEARRK